MQQNNLGFLTRKQVCDKVGFKPSWIYNQINQGKFPAPIKIGHSARWKISDIDDWFRTVGGAA